MELPPLAALQAFVSAARHSSFAEAARDVGRTPSAISHAIAGLEDRLGTALFERAGRSVRLTDAGQSYFEDVEGCLRDLHRATLQVQRRSDARVRVSALPYFTSTLLLPRLSRFQEAHPEVDLRLETANRYADVRNGEADIALRFGQEHASGLVCEPLIAVRGLPVAAPTYLEKAPPLQAPEDLERHTLLHVLLTPGAWQRWISATSPAAVSPERSLEFDSVLSALDAARDGLGIALAMDPLIRLDPRFGRDLVPLFEEVHGPSSHYNFVCQKSALRRAAVRHTRAWILDALREAQEAAR